MEKEIQICQKSNFLISLIKGDVSLIVTYWVFGVLANLLFRAINVIININIIYILLHVSSYVLDVYNYFVLGYQIFIVIAIYNSADKYKGPRVWAFLAQFMAVGAVVVSIVLFLASGSQKKLEMERS